MTKSPDRLTIYRDTAGEWRWRRVAANGQTVATPGEGYTRRFRAIEAACKRNLDVRPENVLHETGLRVRSVLVERYLGVAS
jgi:uncharacterized protein YegP (UPF0339 family)